jgi:hypothetical protein
MIRDWSAVALMTALAVFLGLSVYAMLHDPHPVIHPDCPTEAC